jgi:hypothetical protein
VISEWKSVNAFKDFIESTARNDIAKDMEKVLSRPAEHQVLQPHVVQAFTL